MSTKHGEDNKIKKQSITVSTIIGKAIEAVVAYIVLWFFEPVWKKLVKWWENKKDKEDK
jgi:uncharacterized membrane protein